MVSQLRAVRANSVAELQAEIRRIMQEQDQRSDELSVQYDEDTNHGLAADRQQAWENSIRDAIRSGGAFSAPS
jgi:recombinational DNA repair ATPase RecF